MPDRIKTAMHILLKGEKKEIVETKKLEPFDILCNYVDELHTDYEVWYAKSVRRIHRFWYAFQIASSIATFIFAVISSIIAFGETKLVLGVNLPILLIVLPALSSALANIIIRFRMYDLCMIREQGRIEFQNLHNVGLGFLKPGQPDDYYLTAYNTLVKRAKAIEDDQQVRYFSVTKPETDFHKADKEGTGIHPDTNGQKAKEKETVGQP